MHTLALNYPAEMCKYTEDIEDAETAPSGNPTETIYCIKWTHFKCKTTYDI